MSYIGNQVTSVPYVVDSFAGDAVTSTFGPLVRAPAGTASIAVFINGAYKTPGADYSLNGEYITFFSAPASGATIIVHHLGNGTTTQVPSDGSVTGTKLAINAIRANNIVAGQITGNLIATGAINGNNFAVPITGNMIGAYAISGNQIGTGAISANNFAGGGITSNVLSSNLSISVSRVSETLGINSTVIGNKSASGQNVNIDVLNTTVYYFSSNTTGNVTFNLRGNNINTFDSSVSVGNTISVVITLRHNTAGGRAQTNLMIDGGLITTTRANPDIATGNLIFFAGNTAPAYTELSLLYPTTTLETNVIGINIFKKAANSYFVLYSNTLFGMT
jgi:hypothetical protein